MAAGTQVGAFHPLVAFADIERAVAALQGATIAIEGDDELVALLGDMAEAIGGVPVRLAPGAKAAYHAAAVLAAGGVVALLDAIASSAAWPAWTRPGALAVYLPLVEQTLGQRRGAGHRAALDRPVHARRRGTLARAPRGAASHAPDVAGRSIAPSARARDRARRRAGLVDTGGRRPARATALASRPDAVGLRPMQHSIAAKYAARPAARFVRPSARARERRLGLAAACSFQPGAAAADGAPPART